MDYDNLVKIPAFENVESIKQLYRPVKDINDISPAGKVEFEKAKSILSIVSSKSNLSLYDHLCAILRKIMRFGIEDAVDKLEDISLALKNERETQESEITEITPPDEILTKFIDEKKQFYKLKSEVSREALKSAEEDESHSDEQVAEVTSAPQEEDEEEEDESEIDLFSILSNLHHGLHRFSLAGIGLSPDEVFELGIALSQLAAERKLESVRFWGKVFAKSCCYYVAESAYNGDVKPEDFGWKPDDEEEEKDDEEDAENEDEDDEEPKTTSEESTEKATAEEGEEGEENEEEEEVSEKRILPPIPQPQPPKRKAVPPEEDGTGVNERLYFVSTRLGQPWKCLPFLKPYHITEARDTKRYFTGDLESEVGGSLIFRAREAHYLRAQIARISASTYVSPEDYYTTSGGDEEEEEEDDEEKKEMSRNESFEFQSPLEMYSGGFDSWVHCRPAILDQGRCVPMAKDEDEEEEAEEEEEEGEDENKEEGEAEEQDEDEKEIFEALKETEVPLLRSISEDIGIGKLQPWTIKLSSSLVKEGSILILHSNLWPGAYTFYDGKAFDSIYIGFGYKYSTYHYAPRIPFTMQKEYKAGSDLVEPVESEIEEPEPSEDEDEDEKDEEDADDEEGNEEDEGNEEEGEDDD